MINDLFLLYAYLYTLTLMTQYRFITSILYRNLLINDRHTHGVDTQLSLCLMLLNEYSPCGRLLLGMETSEYRIENSSFLTLAVKAAEN